MAILFIIFSAQYRSQLETEHIEIFSGAQKLIDERIQLEYEREQQEQLLLSVIPAYIAAEVKRRIMNKMGENAERDAKSGGGGGGSGGGGNNTSAKSHGGGGAGAGRGAGSMGKDGGAGNAGVGGAKRNIQHSDIMPKVQPKQRFHELYVQRHNNVR